MKKPATIRILGVAEKDPDFDSRLNHNVTGLPYTHVLAIIVLEGVPVIFHSNGEPVSFDDVDKYFESHTIVHDIELPLTKTIPEVLRYMLKRLGTPYSHRQLVQHLFDDSFQSDPSKPINGPAVTICAEEMARLLHEVTDVRFTMDPDHVHQGHVIDVCRAWKAAFTKAQEHPILPVMVERAEPLEG